ncbi:predicted protein [Naegleria gruberi]|uniref:Predicted protein n=1 Tax=Naegleria gruberi TaxID=5762 RepID=D2V665_NAEGR|nr:uncharacterized protein NAEGRDRAFT_64325 [Naegleria gruberi]EFC47779.1 predicted protein [Naegleria gruberi]|eukprot:XP_002680523.1 predicted protein [Naegleria gruberi strain NEG-M]
MSISIQLSKPFFHPGELLQGNVVVSLRQPIQASSNLSLTFKGKERTKFLIIDDDIQLGYKSRVRTETHIYKKNGKKTLINLQTIAGTFTGGIAAGEYSFPFQIALPAELPQNSNITMKGLQDTYKGAIVYKLKAILGHQFCKIFIPIAPHIIPQPLNDSNEKTFLFGGSGKLKMKTEIPKNVFQPGEMVPIKVSIENESKKDVDSLKVKLMRTATICSDDQTIEQGPDEVHRMEFEGVPQKSKAERMLNYEIPKKTTPSTNGKLLKVKYHLDIECDVAMAIDLEVHPVVEIVYQPPCVEHNISFYEDLPKKWKALFSETKEESFDKVDRMIFGSVSEVLL